MPILFDYLIVTEVTEVESTVMLAALTLDLRPSGSILGPLLCNSDLS